MKVHLERLIRAYVADQQKQAWLIELTHSTKLPPVKAIMAEITAVADCVTEQDSKLIREIAFHYM